MNRHITSDLAVSSVHPETAIRVFTNSFLNPKNEITNAILAANNFGYAYDPIGNRISIEDSEGNKVYSANALNQYTSITNGGLRTLWYDLDGNLTNDGHFAYTWDAENRLTSVVSNGTVIASFKYDYMSRRYEEASAAGTNTFLWDGWNLVSEVGRDSLGAPVTNQYVWGLDLSGSVQGAGGIGGLLSVTRITASGTATYYPCQDGNGNITDYAEADGTVVAHREYDAFGNTVVATGPLVHDLHLWFSTKYLDEETGLYYYGYRYYSPALGRWMSKDPAEEDGGINLYGMVWNDAVDGWDILGLWKDHADLTTEAWKTTVKPDGMQATCAAELLKKLITANKSVDSTEGDDKWHNNHWHFNRTIGEDVAKAVEAYRKLLGDSKKDIETYLSTPSEDNCQKALEVEGWLSHAWQDYYAHAIDKDSDGFKDVGSITGNPDSPGSNMKPSSWDSYWHPGEHGNRHFVEDPAYRAPDLDNRRRLSVYVTSAKFDFFLEKWWPVCGCEACKK